MSLFLSLLLLNPHSRQVMSEMAHPYEMHRTLMRAFPKATDDTKREARDEFGVLFRADVDDRRGVIKVYVQSRSRIEPNWSFLDQLNDYLCPDKDMPEPRDVMGVYQKLRNGQVLSFRLRANPTKRVGKDGDKLKGKRVELAREEEQLDWLIRRGQGREKGASGGFELLMKTGIDAEGKERLIPRINVCCERKQTGRKMESGSRHTTTHLAVVFDGLLRVTDTNAFIETISGGIGSGKAYGFGLLSIAPARGAET